MIRAGTENRTRIVASTGPQDNLYPTPATGVWYFRLKQPIEGVFLYKVFAGKSRRPSRGKKKLLFSGPLSAQD